MGDASAVKEEEDSDFELDVDSDDDVPLAKKKQKGNRQVPTRLNAETCNRS